MNLCEQPGGEQNPLYRNVEVSNNARHYDFLLSMIEASIATGQTWVSESLIKALNFHAIVGLHPQAGIYRVNQVSVANHLGIVTYNPPEPFRIQALMEGLVSFINRNWETADVATLAAHALWGINSIHPFVNGNGRTARAICYYIVCTKAGGPLSGTKTVPEIMAEPMFRQRCINALRIADAQRDFVSLTALVREAIVIQVTS